MFYTIVRIGTRYECHCSGNDKAAVRELRALESAVGASSTEAAAWYHDTVCKFETVYNAEFVGVPESFMQSRAWKTANTKAFADLK